MRRLQTQTASPHDLTVAPHFEILFCIEQFCTDSSAALSAACRNRVTIFEATGRMEGMSCTIPNAIGAMRQIVCSRLAMRANHITKDFIS
jgi:hypothetical protein